jgi:BMFP domain-containing protein YqiC
MPISTAIREVMANQRSVFQASLAALDTWRRLEMELTTAVKIRGTTAVCSSDT